MTEEAGRPMLWLNTIRHLRSSQIAHRVRLRALRLLWNALPNSSAGLVRRATNSAQAWPSDFMPLDLSTADGSPSPELNAKGVFEFLNERRDLGDPIDWEQSDASLLWRYHLHYFEWAWAILAHDDHEWAAETFESLWRSWKTTPFGRGTAWAPYVVSLRTWVLCSANSKLGLEQRVGRELTRSIAEHAGYLRAHMEFDVGGNHLVKNLKALIGAGVFLHDDKLLSFAVGHLVAQTSVQVLDDGGHYERSPSYHCQVLGDLMDANSLMNSAGRAVPGEFTDVIARMRAWLGKMLLPDGNVPFFNDTVPVGRQRIERLAPKAVAYPTGPRVLPSSGYIVAGEPASMFVVVDVGRPCPPDLPAHAHSDCLSFELCIAGRRVLVNSGVSTYERGPRRTYERSTRAHNTVEVDGRDQTETWGAFRAARRANGLLERCRRSLDALEVVASHDGYTRLRGAPVHRRRFSISEDEVRITDEIIGEGEHAIASWLHLATQSAHLDRDGRRVRAPGVEIRIEGSGIRCELVPAGSDPEGSIATGFGERVPAPALVARAQGNLPIEVTTIIKTETGMPTIHA